MRKQRKRIAAVCALMFLVLLLSGCSKAASPGAQATPEPPAQELPQPAEKDAAAGTAAIEVGEDAADRTAQDSEPAEQPVEPPKRSEEPQPAEKTLPRCTISVRCDSILAHSEWLAAEKADLVPADGILLSARTVDFEEGESVFDVLLREARAAKLHMEYTNTPFYGSAYIEGIGNLYEFDCGELSGWMYCVNGSFPNYGCSRYTLADGDVIEWIYTCELGADISGGKAANIQQNG